jgi:hypothetical protein
MQLAATAIRVIAQALVLTGCNPRLVSLFAVAPWGHELAVVGQRGEGAVVGELGGEVSAGGELEEFAVWGRDGVAAPIALLPPLILAELVEGVDYEVGVLVVDGRNG